jgi:hypothetical protein
MHPLVGFGRRCKAFLDARLRNLTLETDGFQAYPEAVDLAFGPYVKYGTIIKDYRNATQPGRYAPPEMVGTERRSVFGIREDEERSICTSHVERNNLTIRTLMKRFTRLSLGFSQEAGGLGGRVCRVRRLRVADPATGWSGPDEAPSRDDGGGDGSADEL